MQMHMLHALCCRQQHWSRKLKHADEHELQMVGSNRVHEDRGQAQLAASTTRLHVPKLSFFLQPMEVFLLKTQTS
jgi:hypothetical protein